MSPTKKSGQSHLLYPGIFCEFSPTLNVRLFLHLESRGRAQSGLPGGLLRVGKSSCVPGGEVALCVRTGEIAVHWALGKIS